MTASPLDTFLVTHFERSAAPGLQIYEVDAIEADSALATDIICTHSSKDDDESAFIEDG